VFIEQRSTGQSNPLTCPDFPGTLADKAALRAAVQSCLAHLPGDLRFYTTAMYTDDVSQLLTDLHYPAANFVGISYGTIAEQVFLLRHPDQVRTLTMISGSPLNIPVYQRQPGNSQLALDYVFALCERQPVCHQAFPHLAADWAALWASVGKSPVVIPAAQSPTGTTLRLDQDWFAHQVYQALFTGNISPIPVFVHTLATATNKTAAMVSLAKAFPAGPSSGGANQMLSYAFRCDEPWASDPPARCRISATASPTRCSCREPCGTSTSAR
jgi:pimeloyl-ACP methyl ester carboxylesterase